MKKANLIVGVLGICLGGYVIYTASGFPANNSAVDPGAAYFPTLLGFFVAVLSVLLIAGTLWKKEDGTDEELTITSDTKRAGVGMGIFILYCLLFKPLGFLLDTVWLCFAGMYLLQNRKYVKMAVISIAVPAAIYVVFVVLLGAKLPAGVLAGIL